MAPKVKEALPQGHQLGNFTLGAPLGQGGFGITYNATHITLSQHVAIKEYLPMEIAARDDDGSPDIVVLDEDYNEIYAKHLQGFVDEAVTLAKFKHPNIVRVQDVFKLNGTAYMVMDFEEGPSFERVLRQSMTKGEEELLGMLHPLIDALEVVHQHGFIHRDIKPDNIIIRPDGSPVLLDFGAAREAIGVKTRQLTVLMTRDYGPYEQFDFGTGKQGAWTDVYALGATLYRAVTGKPPKNAFDRNRARATRQKDPMVKAVDAEVTGYSKAFLTAIDAALEFLPEERPQSIAEWRTLLPPPPAGVISVNSPAAAAVAKGSGGGGVRMLAFGAVGGLVIGGAIAGGLMAGGVIGSDGVEVEQLEAALTAAEAERDQAAGSVASATQAAEKARAEAERVNALLAEREGQRDAAVAEVDRLRGELETVVADAAVLRQRYDDAVARLTQPPIAVPTTTTPTVAGPDPVPVVAAALSEADAARRDDLVSRGEAAAKALRLSTPAGNNAIEFFRQALAIDADSEQARLGLDDVAERYVSLARDRLGRNDCNKAVDYLNKAVTLVPESAAVAAARGDFAACAPAPDAISFRDGLSGGGQGPAMLTLPAGAFRMGGDSEESDDDEKPQRDVTLAARFAIGVNEVTFADWAQYAAATGVAIPDDDGQGQGNLPVINVSYAEAAGYTAWLSEQSGARYRLPTEAEWEYAARAGTTSPRYWGDGNACEYANAADRSLTSKVTYNNPINECEDGHVKAAPVGVLKPNAFGLHDMLGNVWEWTEDCWVDSYADAPADGTAATAGACDAAPIRGASWAGSPRGLRAANRFRFERTKRINLLGFRVVREVR